MSRFCCIVGAHCPKTPFIPKEFDGITIAADGGYHNAEKMGVVPQILLGDFDSLRKNQKIQLRLFKK